ncbi:helix-turn-helix transcriptional regulator [Stackebrandtia nassauensis]|nr:helix-turn-helix transcriptional regulator [Stackebrandtia nassauensis]
MARLGTGIPLVARRAEMRILNTALERARSKRPGALLLSGDAGVGKSRVLSELLDKAREDGDLVFVGRCLDTGESALPYLPFAEISDQIFEYDPELVTGSDALLRLIPGREPGDGGRGGERDLGQLRLFDALRSVIDRLAADKTVVLAFEDLHWADRSSRELLSFLLARLTQQRLLIIATVRSDDLHRRHPLRPLLAELVRLPHVDRLHLEPFAATDIDVFVRSLSTVDVSETVMRAIAERSEGNAFLAEELVSAATADVPRELAEVLLARVERLSAPAQKAIRLASVMGRDFKHRRLSAVADLTPDELDLALREAVAHNVLTIDEATESYSFRHALLHEAVYHDLLPGERSRLHGRVAEAMKTEPGARAAELARHSMESHDLPTALAASVAAAEQAEEMGAPAEVLIHTERALQLWSAVAEPEKVSGSDELELMVWSAWAAGASGEPDRAVAHSRAAIDLADRLGDVVHAAEKRRRLAEFQLGLDGQQGQALAVVREAWDSIADTAPSAGKARLHATMARAYRANRYRDKAAELAAAAIETAQAAAALSDGTDDKERCRLLAAEADARVTRVMAADRDTHDVDTVVERINEAAELARRAGSSEMELRAHYMCGLVLLEAGRLTDALVPIDRGVERAAELGVTWGGHGLELRVVQGITRYMAGDWDGAEVATELVGESVSGMVVTRVTAAGLLVSVGRGRFDIADRRVAHLRERWHLDLQVLTLVGLTGTELAGHHGDPDRAAAFAECAIEQLGQFQENHFATVSLAAVGIAAYADVAEEARSAKDTAAASAAVAAGERLAAVGHRVFDAGQVNSGTVGPEGIAWLRQIDAETARLRGASDPALWREAVAAFGYGEIYRQAIGRWRLAEALLAGGNRADREEAATQLALAAKTADKLDAAPLRKAVAALTRRARLRGEASAAAPANGLLTDRELAVLKLVAVGHTNKQVGAELFISDKTVSVHLSRVMAKLGVTSRTEAVSAAYTAGLLDS